MDPFLDDSSNQSTFDIGALIRAFWRRKWLFVVPSVLCMAMAVVVIKTMTPLYASVGTLRVRVDPIRSRIIANAAESYGVSGRDLERTVRHEMNMLLTSPEFMQAVVRELGLDKAVRASIQATGDETVDDAKAVMIAENRLRRKLRLNPSGNYVYDLEVRDTDPQRAFDLAKYLMSRFVEEYRRQRLSVRASTREFLEEQKRQADKDLAEAEQKLAEYLASMATGEALAGRINSLNLSSTEEKIVRVQTRHDGPDAEEFNELALAARQILGQDPPAALYARDQVVKAILLDLEDLGVELMTTPEASDAYQELDNRLGRLRVQLNNRVEEMVAVNHPGTGVMDRNRLTQYYYSYLYRMVELQVLRRIQQAVANYKQRLVNQPVEARRLDELQAAAESARDLVSTLGREIRQMRMNMEADMSDVGVTINVRRPPVFSAAPVEPDVMKLTLMAVVLSLGLGSGLVVLAIFMDRSFRTVEEIESYLKIKVIGTLPMIRDDHFTRRRRLRVIRWVAIVLAVLAVAAVGFLVVYPKLNM